MPLIGKITVAALTVVLLFGCADQATTGQDARPADIRQLACTSGPVDPSPWHLSKLFDCADDSFYIPHQLWTGADWAGRRDAPCMHDAASEFVVNGTSRTRIDGPIKWSGQDVWARTKTNSAKTQYFTCHAAGIGRVYDSRWPDVPLAPGRCKFPAGPGWKIGETRHCVHTAIKILGIEIDKSGRLFALRFEWFYEKGARLVHDHTYRYQVGVGMTRAWEQ